MAECNITKKKGCFLKKFIVKKDVIKQQRKVEVKRNVTIKYCKNIGR